MSDAQTTRMDESQILQRLKQVIGGRLAVDPEMLSPEARLLDVGLDSFSLVELIFVAEEEFDIKVPFDGLAVSTVQDVIGLINTQLAMRQT